MIKYFAVENFRSIKEENIVEFDSGLPKDSPFVANPTIGIAGANASGKSSLLQALNFTLWFMQDSFLSLDEDKEIPIEPFITCQDNPTKLHLIFSQRIKVDEIDKDVDFEYILYLTRQEVISETLLSYPYKRKRLIYQRERESINQGNTVTKLDSEIWINLRKNCSIISFAAQFNSQTIAKLCKNKKWASNLTNRGIFEYEFNPEMIKVLVTEYNISKDKIIDLLKIADLGIYDFEIIKDIQREMKEVLEKIIAPKLDEIASQKTKDILSFQISVDEIRSIKSQEYSLLLLRHKIEDSFENFLYTSESSGTLKFLAILYGVLLALKLGMPFIFDEIEIKLHQNLVAYVIGLFQNKYENPHGAQLIFSFHNTYFMDILEPSQLWFTEKNDKGYTEIFSAADFKDIKKLQQRSLEELYRLGRFGAKPRGI